MAESPLDNNDMITSFSNPNYTLMSDDAINRNLPPTTTQYYNSNHTSVYENIDDLTLTTPTGGKNRKTYASIDLTDMGIELPGTGGTGDAKYQQTGTINTPDSVTSVDSEGRDSAYSGDIVQVEHTEDDNEDDADWKPKGFLGYYANIEHGTKTDARESTKQAPTADKHDKDRYDDKTKVINSPDSNDSGIQADVHHIQGPINGEEETYATVQKPKHKAENTQVKQKDDTSHEEQSLPQGWEKHEDEDGPYYWHIKSGTIQREPPPPPVPEKHLTESSSEQDCTKTQTTETASRRETQQEHHLQEFENHAFKYAAESLKSLSKQKDENTQRSNTKESSEFPIRFSVRSLGWVRIAEEDLTPEKSSKAVNKCIVDLSLGRNDINDVVGRWGDGKELFMDLDEQSLILIDPQDMTVLNLQPIQSIRVWGVGRDNGRDFAYVARDRVTRKHMCHVFRCDTPARQIANTLRDICQKIMLERSKGLVPDTSSTKSLAITRPNNLPVTQVPDGQKITFESLYNNTSFPTPMEEPKKVIRCHYLGTAQVTRPTGIEVLNGAAEKVYSRVPPEKWVFVSVAVAPSTITISEHGKPDNILAECRVRFLSFMGIAQKNVRLCSFIMHTAQDQFVAHVFHCEPSAGALCKTIEAACKLRYQKCLDSHHNQLANVNNKPTSSHSKSATLSVAGLTSQLKAGAQNILGIIKKKASA